MHVMELRVPGTVFEGGNYCTRSALYARAHIAIAVVFSAYSTTFSLTAASKCLSYG